MPGKGRASHRGVPLPRTLAGAACALLLPGVLACAPMAARRPSVARAELAGVVVESVEKGGAAEFAGIRAGDVLLAWTRGGDPPAGGRFASPFDVAEVEREQAPRGPLTLTGTREGAPFSAMLRTEEWKLQVRPLLAAEEGAAYAEGARLLESPLPGAAERGFALWEGLAAKARSAGDFNLAAWIEIRLADHLQKAGHAKRAEGACSRAVSDAERGRSPRVLSQAHFARARGREEADRPEEALQDLAEALRVRKEAGEEGLFSAFLYQRLGSLALDSGDLDGAGKALEAAFGLAGKLAPESLLTARILHTLGRLDYARGRFDGAEGFYRRALAIAGRLAPGSSWISLCLNNLGNVAWGRGDLAGAERLYRECLALDEKLSPESLDVSTGLHNLGNIAWARGDLAAAEDYYRRALEMGRKSKASAISEAYDLHNLGLVEADRGDDEAAEDHYREALRTLERLAPDSLDVARAADSLGNLFQKRGDAAAAEPFFSRAHAIRAAAAPDSTALAESLVNLGAVSRAKGDLGGAERSCRAALAIQERRAPGALNEALILQSLAGVLEERGDAASAEACLRRALEIAARLAPGSASEANPAHSLGCLLWKRGDASSALPYLEQAVDALDAQRGRLGGGEGAAERFSAGYADFYRDLAEVQIRLRQEEKAFSTLERFRARSLLDMLAERDLDFSADAPPGLLREQQEAEFEEAQEREHLAGLDPEREPAAVASGLARIRELIGRRRTVADKIRAASPRLAALQHPRAMTLEEARREIAPRTLLLSYCVGEAQSEVLALLDGRLEVFTLPVPRELLRKKVRTFRRLLADPRSAPAQVDVQGSELYGILLKPVQRLLLHSRSLIVCPDGPLHILPFAALRTGDGRYLAEIKPVSYVVSATVYSEARRAGEPGRPLRVTAFGDPFYPQSPREKFADLTIRSLLRDHALRPVPASRREVEALAKLYGAEVSVYLGSRAREGEAKALGKGTGILHFACHGFLDERFPLESALALTVPERPAPGEDNGLLQAWEIFEKLRIDADLVTLSACETGLGKEMGGEGLIGLTRAFQYAGARSVLSSLWSVSDESTALLMRRFYGHLKEGKPKAEALRLAQVELIRTGQAKTGRDFSRPFYWAAFVLNGEWR